MTGRGEYARGRTRRGAMSAVANSLAQGRTRRAGRFQAALLDGSPLPPPPTSVAHVVSSCLVWWRARTRRERKRSSLTEEGSVGESQDPDERMNERKARAEKNIPFPPSSPLPPSLASARADAIGRLGLVARREETASPTQGDVEGKGRSLPRPRAKGEPARRPWTDPESGWEKGGSPTSLDLPFHALLPETLSRGSKASAGEARRAVLLGSGLLDG